MHRNLDRRVEALVRIADSDEQVASSSSCSTSRSTTAPRRGGSTRTALGTSHHLEPGRAAAGPAGDPDRSTGTARVAANGSAAVTGGEVVPRSSRRPARSSGAYARTSSQVALVHRPRYGDWSWPKGKVDPGENPIGAATREVAEETGLRRRPRCTPARRRLHDRRPAAASASLLGRAGGRPPDAALARPAPHAEIDQLRWMSISEAPHAPDRPTGLWRARRAYARGGVRHAGAGGRAARRRARRADWKGTELDRPLTPEGRGRQRRCTRSCRRSGSAAW